MGGARFPIKSLRGQPKATSKVNLRSRHGWIISVYKNTQILHVIIAPYVLARFSRVIPVAANAQAKGCPQGGNETEM